MGGLSNRHLFLTVPEAGKSKAQVLAGSGSGEAPLSGWQTAASSLCLHSEQRKNSSFSCALSRSVTSNSLQPCGL